MSAIFRNHPKSAIRRFSGYFLIFGALIFFVAHAANAQKPDSAALFNQLKSPDPGVKLDALGRIYTWYYRFYPLQAHPYIVQALNLARKSNDKEAEAAACFALSYYYSCKGREDSAFYLCQLGLNISKAVKSRHLMAKGHGRLGDIYRIKGEKSKAVKNLKLALELDSSDQETVASNSLALSLLYGDAGCLDLAVFYGLKSLKIRESQNKLIEAGYLSCNLAGFYFQPPYKDEGFKSLEHAIALFRQAGYVKGEAYAYNHMGMAYFGRDDYANAMKYYRKSLALNEKDTLTIRSSYSFNLTNMGDTWLKLNRVDSAQYYFDRALAFSSPGQDAIPLACNYLSMGELQTRLKHYPTAIGYLKKGLYYSKMANFRAQWEHAYNLLSECYGACGDHEQALVYLKKRNGIRDSIVTEKAQQDVAGMMIRYETEKKDQQISLLNVDSRDKQAKIRMAMFIILAILCMTAGMAYLAWLYYRKKLKPQVQTLNFIQEKINLEKEGDNRRLRGLDKVLPPGLKPFIQDNHPEFAVNKTMVAQLEAMLTRDRIFLNENLTMAETAHLLETNTSYLSRLINEHYKMNFSAFLNRYRIEEAKKMILDDQFNNFSMEGIAKSSGFRSKSTFNQVFKHSTGLTPSEFAIRNGKVRA